jgi:hypothetical protein
VADDRPALTPGERRLERPPSERYLTAEPPTPPEGSLRRGLALGAIAAVIGALVVTLAGGVITITAGLLVVAAVVGWATAVAVVSGTGTSVPRFTRTTVATVLALAGIGLGQIGLWLLGREEGGVLSLLDYLGEVFGVLAPLELGIAGIVAWWRAR